MDKGTNMADRFFDGDSYEHEPPCYCDTPAGPELCPMHGGPSRPMSQREWDQAWGLAPDEQAAVIHHVRDPKGDEDAHG